MTKVIKAAIAAVYTLLHRTMKTMIFNYRKMSVFSRHLKFAWAKIDSSRRNRSKSRELTNLLTKRKEKKWWIAMDRSALNILSKLASSNESLICYCAPWPWTRRRILSRTRDWSLLVITSSLSDTCRARITFRYRSIATLRKTWRRYSLKVFSKINRMIRQSRASSSRNRRVICLKVRLMSMGRLWRIVPRSLMSTLMIRTLTRSSRDKNLRLKNLSHFTNKIFSSGAATCSKGAYQRSNWIIATEKSSMLPSD